MSVKSEVSADYTAAMLKRHGGKPVNHPFAIITGANNDGSIGEAIFNRIEADDGKAMTWAGDVTQPIEPGEFRSFNTLIMCHGVTHLDWFEDAPPDKVYDIFEVNLIG